MIPSSFSIIGVRPRFPRMVKIVTQEIEAKQRRPKNNSRPLAIEAVNALMVRAINMAPPTEKNDIKPTSISSM